MEVEMMSCVHSIFIIHVYVYIPFLNVIYLFIYSFIFWKNLRGINSLYKYLMWIRHKKFTWAMKKPIKITQIKKLLVKILLAYIFKAVN